MEYDELVYACALNRIFNYSCDKARALVSRFSSPGEIFKLNRRELVELFGSKSHFVDLILDKTFLDSGQKDVDWANGSGVRIFYIADSDYPHRLRECNDAPVILYFKGSCDLNRERLVSIVGGRHPTPYGIKCCEELVASFSELENPPIIVSGLAYGIDITAHKAALRLGLETVGVMATGLDTIYPSYHRKVAAQMVGQGALVSDFPIKTVPVPINFIRRNRIIAALSDATVLVESRKDGGGVITSKMASSYNREVFAYPGRVDDVMSQGCNLLIRESCAEMVVGNDSVRGALGWKKLAKDGGLKAKFLTFDSDNEAKRKIITLLYQNPHIDVDDLIEKTGLYRSDVLVAVTELELEGRIQSDLAGRYILVR